MAESTTLTARRMQRTRHQIAEAAATLFYERGYDHATIEDIAAVVEVSPRTIYRYFATKEDLIVSLGHTNSAAFLAALQARPRAERQVDAVTAAVREALAPRWEEAPWRVRAFLRLIRDTPVLRARWVEEAHGDQRNLATVLAERADSVCDLRYLMMAGAVTMAINTAIQHWVDEESAATPAASVYEALARLSAPLL